jgi:hypothetical protein
MKGRDRFPVHLNRISAVIFVNSLPRAQAPLRHFALFSRRAIMIDR